MGDSYPEDKVGDVDAPAYGVSDAGGSHADENLVEPGAHACGEYQGGYAKGDPVGKTGLAHGAQDIMFHLLVKRL